MTLTADFWHHRFIEQAGWTRELRAHVLGKTGFSHARKILEAGCGTGVLLSEMAKISSAQIYGLDKATKFLRLAKAVTNTVILIEGDIHSSPFKAGEFDLVVSHFLLLWLENPLLGLIEMRRITRSGGYVIAMAEPDYGGRIDYPIELSQLGVWQAEALYQQGANPRIGRKLGELFLKSGLVDVQSGVMGGEWNHNPTHHQQDIEWPTLEYDLNYLPQFPDKDVLNNLKQIGINAIREGRRIIFVPTFYAWGKVP